MPGIPPPWQPLPPGQHGRLDGLSTSAMRARRSLALFAVDAPAQPRALVRYYVAGCLELGDEHADGQQDLLAGASLRARGDGFLPILTHLLGKERRQRLKLGNGGVEQQSGAGGHARKLQGRVELYKYTAAAEIRKMS